MAKLNSYINYTKQEDKIYMPNEIFDDLTKHIPIGEQCAFTYSFYYLISWLYRYAKYGHQKITIDLVKKMLNYGSKTRSINYIIKKGGVLDEIGYTTSSTDYPIEWLFEDDSGDWLEFTMFSDLDKEMRSVLRKSTGTNYKIKVPVKGLWRNGEVEGEPYDGTFYDISQTHEVLFSVFETCMDNNDKLGTIAFYIYGYIKCRCQWFNNEFNRSMENIGKDLNLHRNTVDTYLGTLKEYNIVDWKENETWRYYEGEYIRDPHTYSIKS